MNTWLLSLFVRKPVKKYCWKDFFNFPLSSHVWSLQNFIKKGDRLLYKFSWRNIDSLLLVHLMDLVKTCVMISISKFHPKHHETSIRISQNFLFMILISAFEYLKHNLSKLSSKLLSSKPLPSLLSPSPGDIFPYLPDCPDLEIRSNDLLPGAAAHAALSLFSIPGFIKAWFAESIL